MRGCRSEAVDMAVPLPHLIYAEKTAAPFTSSSTPEPTLAPNPPTAAAALPPDGVKAPTFPAQDELKRIAAHRAVKYVKSGMVLGLGTGSTAAHALDLIGDLLRRGELRDVVGIPTSRWAEGRAAAAGIPLSDLATHPVVDLAIDGADEVDPHLNLVKGRGGSLLREKMVEGASRRFVVIVDESKQVERIGGSRLAVPVEVVPFAWEYTLVQLKRVFEGHEGCEARLRAEGEGKPFVTDNGNYIVDLYFEKGIERDLGKVSDQMLRLTGVVDHGIFLGMASSVIVAGRDGSVTVLGDSSEEE